MLIGPRATTGFRWWTPREAKVQIRRFEVQARLGWAVVVRWCFVVIGIIGSATAALEGLPVHPRADLLLLSTGLLALSNTLFHLILSGAFFASVAPRRFLIAQALGDFLALSILSYALGVVETPVTVLFLPQVLLLTLLLNWRVSLTMSVVAAAMASMPLVLVHFGILDIVSIFGSNLPHRLSSSGVLTAGFGLSILACFTTSWYLVSQVSNGLVLREKRLEQDHERLEQVNRTKTMATLHATHELKAPLAAIKSYVYTLRDGYTGALPPAAQRVIGRIGDRCDVLTRRITSIIHLSNLETLSHDQLKLRETDLYEVLKAECEEAAHRGHPRKVQLQLADRPQGSVRIAMVDGELQSLLANLLDNAVEYSHPEGTVQVGLQSDAAGLHLKITDHGIGIPHGNVARVFLEHFRSDNAVAHKPNGSGLGMAIVREIARLHHAEVHIASVLNEGTEVTVTFPHYHPERGGPDGTHTHH